MLSPPLESAHPADPPLSLACIKRPSAPCTCGVAPFFRALSNPFLSTFENPATTAPTIQKQITNFKHPKRPGMLVAAKPIGRTQRIANLLSFLYSISLAAMKAGLQGNQNTSPSPKTSRLVKDKIHPN